MYRRFAAGLGPFLRRPIHLDEAHAIVRERLARRDEAFLRIVEKGIYGHPRSPYLPLLEAAGCGMEDLRGLVRSRGVEGALGTLLSAGVYVTFEEFKARRPIVRGGREIPVRPEDFDNPWLSPAYEVETGGTTGTGTRVATDLDHIADRVPAMMLSETANGVADLPRALWRGTFPDGSGVHAVLTRAKMGSVHRRWFTPVTRRHMRPPLRHRLATRALLALARRHGVPLPSPEPLPLDQALTLARWAAETAREEGGCHINVSMSGALRTSLAAREHGLDLTGVVFSGGGEPATEARIRVVTSSGARCVPSYYFAEVGPVGLSCGSATSGTDHHFLHDHLALVQEAGAASSPFTFTTLLPTAPKILLNVQIDDEGSVERRDCGCLLGAYYPLHIRHIRSFGKLTGEGVTVVESELVQLLEEWMPARLGGTPLDYQLIEEDDAAGFTRLHLRVSPAVPLADDAEAVEALLAGLREASLAGELAQAIWRQAGTIAVERAEPEWTARGKRSPFLRRRPGAGV